MKKIIELGDVVKLIKPYKSDDFMNNPSFLAALNNGILPESYWEKHQIYENWQGFTHGAIAQILCTNLDGSPRRISLFLYDAQKNGTWLMYSYSNGVPMFVDFHVREVELIHKSCAATYSAGVI